MLQGRSRDIGILTIIAILALLMLHAASVQNTAGSSSTDRLEALAIVTRVVDGDTFDATVIAIYKDMFSSINGSGVRVRLADINAPELGTPEGEASKDALRDLLEGREVYLDIDDLYVYDRYGRIVAVAYLPINATHALNINLWLVRSGYASITNYPNEFDPAVWSLYIPLPSMAGTTGAVTATMTRVVTMSVTAAATETATQNIIVTEKISIPATVTIIATGPATTITKTAIVTTRIGGSPDAPEIFPWLIPLTLALVMVIAAAVIIMMFRWRRHE